MAKKVKGSVPKMPNPPPRPLPPKRKSAKIEEIHHEEAIEDIMKAINELPPVKKTPISSTIIQWVLLIAPIAIGYAIYHYWFLLPSTPHMSGGYVLLFALSLAFFWVEVLKWGSVKPFTCVKCLTGWFALILSLTFHTQFWYLYPVTGVFIGAMYSGIKMRWL